MIELTATDLIAIENGDSGYINNKGAKLYGEKEYKDAVEYYRLASSMGDVQATSNLGYCYLYGREIEQNIPLAISYFKISARRKSIDSAYKLGNIYGSDKWGVKDKELSIYYYSMAANFILDSDYVNRETIKWNDDLRHYPSLCFALGREMAIGGGMNTNIEIAYLFLQKAKEGYEIALANGEKMYLESYNGVLSLLSDPQFDIIREELDDEEDE